MTGYKDAQRRRVRRRGRAVTHAGRAKIWGAAETSSATRPRPCIDVRGVVTQAGPVAAATRYVRSDGLHIAYQVQGEGPLDLVFMPHWASHVELLWDEPVNARFLRRLASFSRLIMFDRRGVGLSDPVPDEQIEAATTVEDLGCVLDAIESPRAVLVACDGAGFGAIHFAVQHPERVEALVLLNSTARVIEDVDYRGFAQSEVRDYLESVSEQWVDGAAEIDVADPSMVTNVAYREWLTRYQRAAVRPATAAAITRGGLQADVRALLPLVTARTLVIHRADDMYFPAQQGRYLAEHIPDATYIELPGSDHTVMFGDAARILDEIELFLLGRRRSDYERSVATVLFVDIVNSTQRAVAVGDLAWRDTWKHTKPLPGVISANTEVVRSSPRAMSSSWCSRCRPTQSDAPSRFVIPPSRESSACVRGSTPANSSSEEPTLRASLSTSELELKPSLRRVRSWFPEPWPTSSWDRICVSRPRAYTPSEESPDSGNSGKPKGGPSPKRRQRRVLDGGSHVQSNRRVAPESSSPDSCVQRAITP